MQAGGFAIDVPVWNRTDQNQGLGWQGRQGSNLRQPVLETGTLPTELHPCGNQASPLIRAVSSIGDDRIASRIASQAAWAKRLTPCSTPMFCAKLGDIPTIPDG